MVVSTWKATFRICTWTVRAGAACAAAPAGAARATEAIQTSERAMRTPAKVSWNVAPAGPVRTPPPAHLTLPFAPRYTFSNDGSHPVRLQRRHRRRRAATLRRDDRHAGGIRLHARPRHLLPRVPRLRRSRVLPVHLRPHGPRGGRAGPARGGRAQEPSLRARGPRLPAAGA